MKSGEDMELELERGLELFSKRGVSHHGLAIYMKKYLKAKEE
jgi:hypothetical protein